MVTEKIEFRDCPLSVINYYDKGPSACRSISAKRRMKHSLKTGKLTVEFIVTHSFGVDTWREDRWGDWKMSKSTYDDAPCNTELRDKDALRREVHQSCLEARSILEPLRRKIPKCHGAGPDSWLASAITNLNLIIEEYQQ